MINNTRVLIGSVAEQIGHNKYNWKPLVMEMSGPPGTGKTLFAKVMKEECEKLFELNHTVQKDFGDFKLLCAKASKDYLKKVPEAEIFMRELPPHSEL